MRFSPRFLNAFFLVGRPAFFLSPPSGVADASIGSFLAISSVSSCQYPVASSFCSRMQAFSHWRPGTGNWKLHSLLLRHRALTRAFPRARVRFRPLTAHRQVAPVAQPAIAADLHQPLDVHGNLLAEISFDAALLFDHAADLPHVVFREILDADVGVDARRAEDVARALAADAVNVREPDLDALGPRKIDASYACHSA